MMLSVVPGQNPTRMDFVHLLASRAERSPLATVFTFLDGLGADASEMTYADLDRRARAIATRIRAAGAAGERVLIVHPPGPEYVAALFGCWYAGAVAVPTYAPGSSRSNARLRAIAADCGARLALSTHAWTEILRSQARPNDADLALEWLASDRPADGAAEAWQPPRFDSDAVVMLQYTSGSTSAPKGVMLTFAHFFHNVAALAERARATEEDRIVSWLPAHHDLGLVTGILLPVLLGMHAVLLSPSAFLRRPLAWLEAIAKFRGTVCGGPNFAFELCVRRTTAAERGALDLRSWRVAFIGAERVRAETLDRFASAFVLAGFRKSAFTPCYGLAEATVGVSLRAPGPTPPRVKSLDAEALGSGQVKLARPGGPCVHLVGCGSPLPGTAVVVVDPEARTQLAHNRVGELWVRSQSIALGYWGKPELEEATFHARLGGTAEPRAGGYLRTGDLGFVDDGEIFITGRLKDLILVNGVNHYPEDIEASVEAHLASQRPASVAAFSVEAEGEERLVVVCEADRSRDALQTADAIRDAVAHAHELPVHEIVLVAPGGVPVTSSGKVQRSLARRQYLDDQLIVLARSGPSETGVAAPDPMVDRVRAVMAEVLGFNEVRAHDDFFLLGGHSLMATQLASRVRERLGVDLPLRAVFESPTASALAARIQSLPAKASSAPIVRIDRLGRLPLSFSQERMWFLHQLDPLSPAYNVAGALSIEGPLDVDALQAAFDDVFDRHEILRSNFPTFDGEPTVHIAPTLRARLEPIDLSGSADSEERALEHASAMASAPFDLARDPLVRAALYQTGEDRHVLAVSMHHMVTDAWSMGIFGREIIAGYVRHTTAPSGVRLSDSDRLEYVDYAHWQRLEFAREGLRADLEYWRHALRGATPLELPTDRPRSTRRSAAGGFEPLQLSTDLLRSVRELGAQHGATPFMVLLAAFNLVLHRYTGQTDLVIGVPVANRNRLASEGLMGTLVNTLPLRVTCEPEMSFATLLDRVRTASLEAYSHQDLPFERLVAELEIERRPGQSPLVQIMFDYQNAPAPTQEMGALRIRPLVVRRGASQFDLSLVIFDTELGHMAGVEYAADWFEPSTIRRFLGHFVLVLESVCSDPGCAVSRTMLLTRPERDDLLARADAAFRVPRSPAAVHSMVEAWVAATPDAPAVSDGDGTLSYRELDRRASRLAAHLTRRGAAPGRRVAIFLDRSSDLVVALLAVLRTGAAYVPIDPRYPVARIAFVLDDAAPHVVVTQSSLRSTLPAAASRDVVCVDDDAVLEEGNPLEEALAPLPDPDRPAYVLYTSGSTGRPKGVVVSVGALTNFLRSMAHTPGIAAGDRLLSVTTISFDIAGLELWLPIVTGASVYVAPFDVLSDGPRLRALAEAASPTMMQATPATWRLLLEAGWRGDERLKILCGGETFPRELAEQLLPRAASVWNMYGPTETTIWSTVHRVTSGDGPIPIGAPIDRTRIYLLDSERALLPLGVPGEIYIGGDGVALGYFQRPELTEERFVADPFAKEAGARMYRTGDLGRIRAGGAIEHLGRVDHQIKVRGYRIEPGEIETVLEQSGRAKEAVVVAREDVPGHVRLVAYYVPAGPETSTADALRAELSRVLPAYMVPSAFVALAALPQTPSGKVDRKALPAPDGATLDGEYTAPRDSLERELVALWEEILGTTRPSVRADFFSLGGHSLLAVRLLSRIERAHRVELPLGTLLERPTIEALAEHIRVSPSRGIAPFAHLVAVQAGGLPPLVCVHGAGGNVLNLRGIARSLGPDQAFYAMQARGLDGRQLPFERIEEMAAAYLGELRAVQPKGPYRLSGYCGGGLVAFEMARLLQSQGETVALLALIDTYRPGAFRPAGRMRRFVRGVLEQGARYAWTRAVARAVRDVTGATRWLKVAYSRWRGHAVPHELRDYWLTRAFFRAAAKYSPGIYRGHLIVLRALEVHPLLVGASRDLGWGPFASEGVAVYDVPGSHDTITLDPNLAVVAATLKACLSDTD